MIADNAISSEHVPFEGAFEVHLETRVDMTTGVMHVNCLKGNVNATWVDDHADNQFQTMGRDPRPRSRAGESGRMQTLHSPGLDAIVGEGVRFARKERPPL